MDRTEQMAFFYEIFDASLPRLGVGNEALTKRALELLLPALSQREGGTGPSRILEIGCGNGAATLCLAEQLGCPILAMDNHQPFLHELERRAAEAGLSGKIRTSLRDMKSLSPDDGPFELIWSEGAIFIVGFREGLNAWRSLLTPGGGLAVSELAWLRSDVPDECRQFFEDVYPAMTSVEANLATIESCGYELVGHFVQPESAWWEPFYGPLEERLGLMRKRYAEDAQKMALIEHIQMEIDIYRQYSAYYSNVFYLMRRP